MESSYSSRGCALLAIIFILIIHGRCDDNSNSATTKVPSRGETLHLYLVAIPESSVANKLHRFRQDDEDGGTGASFAQTGEYLGQIIRGVLGGDLRPVFAGSVAFVEEPMAQQNLGSFLGTIAPALNLALREVYNRAQTAFGFGSTTPQPTPSAAPAPQETAAPVRQPTLQEIVDGSANSTIINPSNYITVEEGGVNKTVSVYLDPELSGQQAQGKPQQEQSQKQQPPTSTTSWQYVLNQINSETTTPPPLPLITRFRSTVPSIDFEDGDDDGRRI